ncbi:FAD-binding protein [bacterium]|nr:FAD-binding protein [bacterium]
MTLLRDRLAEAVGGANVLTTPDALAPFAEDAKFRGQPPVLAVRAGSIDDVARVVGIARDAKTPVIPRGAGTGVVGGAVPESPVIVLDLSRMTRIHDFHPRDMTVGAEAGVITGDLHRFVEARGLFYPPDPASADSCSIGGNAATNAGGLRALKYGVTGNYVLAMTVVLANGEAIRVGGDTRKQAVGYDLRHLFVGSEGTLGVICDLTLRLVRKPDAHRALVASFADIASALGGVARVLESDVLPAALELVDEPCVRAVERVKGISLPYAAPYLLVEVDGREENVRDDIERLGVLLEQAGATAHLAMDESQRERLWSVRRAVSESLSATAPKKLADDITVPLSAIADLILGARKIGEARGLSAVCYGHAGDGNVHVNVLYDPETPGEKDAVHAFREDLFELTWKLRGTISGEHGVGISKRPYFARELSPGVVNAHRAIKRALDPNNILNPGKIWEG